MNEITPTAHDQHDRVHGSERRGLLRAAAGLGVAAIFADAQALSAGAGPAEAHPSNVGGAGASKDFEFMAGEWDVINRQLKTRGVKSTDWEVFPSHETAQLLMNGMVSVDVATFPTKGFMGTTVRLYDPAKDQWAAYWINSKDGLLQPPVYGRFKDGTGLFAGDDMDGDKPVKVRFEWTDTHTDAPRWSQAFSYDGGLTWETNWHMQFRRRSS